MISLINVRLNSKLSSVKEKSIQFEKERSINVSNLVQAPIGRHGLDLNDVVILKSRKEIIFKSIAYQWKKFARRFKS